MCWTSKPWFYINYGQTNFLFSKMSSRCLGKPEIATLTTSSRRLGDQQVFAGICLFSKPPVCRLEASNFVSKGIGKKSHIKLSEIWIFWKTFSKILKRNNGRKSLSWSPLLIKLQWEALDFTKKKAFTKEVFQQGLTWAPFLVKLQLYSNLGIRYNFLSKYYFQGS